MSAISTGRAEDVRQIADRLRSDRGPLLEILHAVQRAHGYIDEADLPVIADSLNISVAEVHGVVSFYHDFRSTPPPAHLLVLCRAEACQSVGAQPLFDDAAAMVRERDDIELRQVFCFGNCALGPTGMLDGRLHGRLDSDQLSELISGLDGGEQRGGGGDRGHVAGTAGSGTEVTDTANAGSSGPAGPGSEVAGTAGASGAGSGPAGAGTSGSQAAS